MQKNNKKHIFMLVGIGLLSSALVSWANPVSATDLNYNIDVDQTLSVTIPSDSLSLVLDPSAKPFDYKDLAISVETNNVTGYRLMMSADSTSLLKTNDDTKAIQTLPALDGGYTDDTFVANRWGYKIGDGNYIPFVSGAVVANGDTAVNNDITNFRFATKIDFSQPSGEYKTTLNFTAVVNPIPTFYMQNLDTKYCTTSPMIAIDKRDGEEYMIQRLADGRCWLLENMRLDPTDLELEDLEDNTNAPNQLLEYFMNGGGTMPNAIMGVSDEWTTSTNSNDAILYPKIYTGNINKVPNITYGIGSGKVGVYYNYCAATAGTYCYEGYNASGNAQYDICPTGWRLPTGDDEGEFNVLYEALGSDSKAFKNALSTPLTGRYSYGKVEQYGGQTTYWTSTYFNPNGMNEARVDFSNVEPDAGNYSGRGTGYSVRCILKED